MLPQVAIVPNQDGTYISGVVERTVLRGRFTVITRVVATAFVLILAFGAFWLGALDAAHMLDPNGALFMLFVGIVWLLLAGIVWFKWDLVRDAFRNGRVAFGATKNEHDSGPPIDRFGSNEIRGIFIAKQPRSRRSASPDQ